MLSEEMDAKLEGVLPPALRAAQRLSDTLRLVAWPMGQRNRAALLTD